jgi:hypothetical protein
MLAFYDKKLPWRKGKHRAYCADRAITADWIGGITRQMRRGMFPRKSLPMAVGKFYEMTTPMQRAGLWIGLNAF